MNICAQLHQACHYALNREMGFAYLRALYESKRKGHVQVQFIDPSEHHTDAESFVFVRNNVPIHEFAPLGMDHLSYKMDNTNKAVEDPTRGNLIRNFGFCSQTNSVRTKESLGLPFPRTFEGTDEMWVQNLFHASTSLLEEFAGAVGVSMFTGDKERSEHFASSLVSNLEGGHNVIEALSIHKYRQQVAVDEGGNPLCHDMPWAVRVWECLESGNVVELDAMKSVTIPSGSHLLGCHKDTSNDKSNELYFRVFNTSEWRLEHNKSVLARVGTSNYGKQVASDFMRDLRTFGPLLRQLEKGYHALANDVKIPTEYVASNQPPKRLSGPHVNKLGVYYSVFITQTRTLLSVHAASLADPLLFAAAMVAICTKGGHKPALFYDVTHKLLADPCCYGGKHLTEYDVLEFVYLVYEDMFCMEEAAREGTVTDCPVAMSLRMQPFHNQKMTRLQLSCAADTLIQCAIQLKHLTIHELEDSLADKYHQLVCVFRMESNPDSLQQQGFKEKFNVMGIHAVGPLAAHLIIGVCCGIGLFPACLLSHAEVPVGTGYELVFNQDGTGAAELAYSVSEHYGHTQKVLKALAVLIDRSVAIAEEVVCQVKKINTSKAPPISDGTSAAGTRALNGPADYVFPNVPYLNYNSSSKSVESWMNGVMAPLGTLFFIDSALDGEADSIKEGFWKAGWPNKQNNNRKKRSAPAQPSLSKLCKLSKVGKPETTCGLLDVVSVQNDKFNVVLQRGKMLQKFRLDIYEPDPARLLGGTKQLKPQKIVRHYFSSHLGTKPQDYYDISTFTPSDEAMASVTNPYECKPTKVGNQSKKPQRGCKELASLGHDSPGKQNTSGRKKKPPGFYADSEDVKDIEKRPPKRRRLRTPRVEKCTEAKARHSQTFPSLSK